MTYRIVWTPEMEVRLAVVYLHALETGGDAASVTRASADIDRRLERNPSEEGESREGRTRVAISGSLMVTFEVDEAQRMVSILWIHDLTPRR